LRLSMRSSSKLPIRARSGGIEVAAFHVPLT